MTTSTGTPGVTGPPLPAWAPLVSFLAVGAVLVGVVVGLVRPPGPLDQPDAALQRDGLLRDGPVVPPTVAGVTFGDRAVVLLFERRPPDPDDVRAWAQDVPDTADVRLVLPEPARATFAVETVIDPTGALAAAVALPTPVDGGPGVGYAVVDAERVVRYRTLDPSWPGNGFEVATIAGAVT